MEILNRYPVMKSNIFFSIILFLTLLSIVVFAVVCMKCFYYTDLELQYVVISLLITGCLVGILSQTPREISTEKYRFEVLFTDDEYLNATKGRYEIVGKKNHIYILEET